MVCNIKLDNSVSKKSKNYSVLSCSIYITHCTYIYYKLFKFYDNDTVSSKHADGLVTFFSIRNGECIVSMIELPVRKNPKQNATQGIKQERNGHCYGAVTIIIRDAYFPMSFLFFLLVSMLR